MDTQKKQVLFLPHNIVGEFEIGTSLLDAARELGVGIESICGGTGTCAKCKCQIQIQAPSSSLSPSLNSSFLNSSLKSVSPIQAHEQKLIQKHNFKKDERASCQTKVLDDVTVFIPEESRTREAVVRKAAGKTIETINPVTRKYFVTLTAPTLEDQRGDWDRLQDALTSQHQLETEIDFSTLTQLADIAKPQRAKAMELTVTAWQKHTNGVAEIIRIENDDTSNTLLGLAVDLGTTTMAAYLCDMHTGKTIATASTMNPQITLGGEDVMHRIAACEGESNGESNLKRLQTLVTNALSDLAQEVTEATPYDVNDIAEVVLVANTCMHHIFLGLDPESLGKSPFNPRVQQSVNVKARDLNVDLLPSCNIHLLANQAGFVGADNTAVAIALEPYNSEEIVAIIDIGTNGEILVGNKEKLYSTSCPTGPALEGASIKFGVRASRGAIEKIRIDVNNNKEQQLDIRFKVIGKEAWHTRLET